MDRRLVITISLLILALAALATSGPFNPRGAPAAAQVARVPEPEPASCAQSAPPVATTTVGAATLAAHQLAPAGMSGEFSARAYACRDASRAPAIHVPHDTWRPQGIRAGHHPDPRDGGAAARAA
jgi:hypothetical protein